ncbi:hypothetical protein CDL15_Pgr016503 [Punica granatum]|uniref:Uncharacterized protein n=1 Tax=Punica granatum TaxID=22663 RepID=A0A218WK41_PUNGR|nr:hypothetical protein CDL15_Pgr016503 [Punica granatum]
MAEEDRVDISEEVNLPSPTHSQPPPAHAPLPPTPAGMLPAYSGAPPTHLQPPTSLGAPLARTSQTSSASDDQACIAALKGTVNQMATNMAELLALLRGPNRASSSSTPPPGQGPTIDPTPRVPPTQAPKNMEVPTPPTLHTSMAHPFTSPYPLPPAPTAVPLPPATGNHLHRLAAYYGRLNRGSPVPPLSHFFSGPSHTIGGTLDGPSSDSDDTPAAPSAVGNHLHRLAAYYGRLNRGSPVPPLSHFFSGPSHTIGGTLDGPSSDSDDTPAAPSAVYAVTEELPSGVHILLAQENEELDNWTSVPRYSAVIADV